jgi:PPOX class probable FMN-dependent enzyme
MKRIQDIAELERLYGTPSVPALKKVATKLTPLYRKWIQSSRFCILSTVGPEGTDASPRGDDGPVVTELDERTLLLPDWRGNNRLDSLRNIVSDGRASLMFMVPGSRTVVRVNGRAALTDDADLCAKFDQASRKPATVIVFEIAEVYTQCARAIMRADLWNAPDVPDLPTPGAILAEMTSGEIDGAAYDKEWPDRARKSMW